MENTQSTEPDTEPFAGIEPHESIDVVLQTIQESQVQFSTMADEKANIMITVCSILLTLAVGKLEQGVLVLPIVVFCAFVAPALVFAILTVIPSSGHSKVKPKDIVKRRSAFNPFFFMHFSLLPINMFEREFERAIGDTQSLYRNVARDIYNQGVVLRIKKYRYLRWSYLALLYGVVLSFSVLLVQLVLGEVSWVPALP